MKEEAAKTVGLQLPLLDEVHDAGHEGEGEGAIGDNRDGGVGLQPGMGDGAGARPGRAVDGSDEGERLEDEGERRGENTQKREAIGRADDEVEQHHGPAQENEHLEEIGQRAGIERMAAHNEETGLEGEAARHRGEIDPGRLIPAPAQDEHGMGEAEQEQKVEAARRVRSSIVAGPGSVARGEEECNRGGMGRSSGKWPGLELNLT